MYFTCYYCCLPFSPAHSDDNIDNFEFTLGQTKVRSIGFDFSHWRRPTEIQVLAGIKCWQWQNNETQKTNITKLWITWNWRFIRAKEQCIMFTYINICRNKYMIILYWELYWTNENYFMYHIKGETLRIGDPTRPS